MTKRYKLKQFVNNNQIMFIGKNVELKVLLQEYFKNCSNKGLKLCCL